MNIVSDIKIERIDQDGEVFWNLTATIDGEILECSLPQRKCHASPTGELTTNYLNAMMQSWGQAIKKFGVSRTEH
jgi:hypothetical protein